MMEVTAFAILMFILAISDIVSTATDAKLPSMFTIAVLSIIGYWTGIIPTNLFETTGISVALVYLVYYLQLANMGSMIPIKEMISQWKTIVVAVGGIIGITLGALLLGGIIFGKEAAIVGAPPLSGGIIAYEIMRAGAESIGRNDLAIMALAVFVLQSFVGYPLTAFFLKKEARKLLANKGKDEVEVVSKDVVIERKNILPQLPEKFNTDNTVVFKLALAAFIGIVITNFLNSTFKPEGGGDFISRYVVLLIVGVILTEIGFLDKSASKKGNINGFTTIVIIGFAVISGLASATPDVLTAMLVPTIGIIVTGVIGLIIVASLVGKFLGYSPEMSISVALTALYGYPGTEILTNEAVKVTANNKEEFDYLIVRIMPKMLIGGFTTVTIGSVFLAGILVNFL